MNYCAVMYQKYVYINPSWKSSELIELLLIGCRCMYYQVPEFQTIVGPSPLAIRETRIMLAPVVMITTLHVIDATY